MSLDGKITRATLTPLSGPYKDRTVDVHFNPVSLEYSITNKLEAGRGDKKKQHVSQTSGKLSLELIFDTTDNGVDVTEVTANVAQMMRPDKSRTPAIIHFEWGTYSFRGMVESYKEKIDFFSADGVPLRATVSLSLAAQDIVFAEPGKKKPASKPDDDDAVDAPQFGGLQQTAEKADNPDGARKLGEDNDEENLRFPDKNKNITVSDSPTLNSPIPFTGGGSGLGLDLGIGGGFGLDLGLDVEFGLGLDVGLGLDLGLDIDLGLDLDLNLSVGAQASVGAASEPPRGGFGAASGLDPVGGAGSSAGSRAGASGSKGSIVSPQSARIAAVRQVATGAPPAHRGGRSSGSSTGAGRAAQAAGMRARDGAFAGLHTQPRRDAPRPRRFDIERLLPPPAPIGTDAGVTFDIGGRARTEGGGSMGTNVSGPRNRRGLRFDEN